MTHRAVLIFSDDPLSAALLAAAVEFSGHAPHFSRETESSRDALRRVRPRLVLIDCDHEESCSDEFVGPALMMDARIVLFRSRRTQRDIGDFPERLALLVVDMPPEHESLSKLFRDLLSD